MKKRFLIFTLILPLLLLASCSNDTNTLTNLSDKELTDGQTLVTGQVTSRVGNDLELALGTLITAQIPANMDAMPSGDMPADAMPSGDIPADAMPSGDMPAGAMPSGDMPAGAMPSGDMPAGRGAANASGSTDGTTSDSAAMPASGSQIQLSGETMSLTIPVGTTVLVTSNDTLAASSFGRIQVDDILQLILKTQSDGTQIVIEAQIME